ncbi:hypothetical protein J6590_108145, partial [Homalodisca vitripennis]
SLSEQWVAHAGRPRRGYATVTVTTDSWFGEDKATRTASKAAVPVSGRAGRPRRGYVTDTVTTDSWFVEDKATRTASKAAVPVSGQRVDCG